MGRPSTMPPPWIDLADAWGGVGKLASELGISGMHLHRLAAGKVDDVRKPLHAAVRRAAATKGLPDPLSIPAPPPPIPADVMEILELFGGSTSMEEASQESVAHLKALVTDEQLIALTELAEAKPGSVSEKVLRAAGWLLEVA